MDIIFLFLFIALTSFSSVWVYFNKPKFFMIFKIIPIIGLVLFLLSNMIITKNFTPFCLLILFGITIGVAGDLFIAAGDKTFVFGLISFLITHILYVIAFNITKTAFVISYPLLAVIIVISIAFAIYITIKMQKGGDKALIIPVWVYISVLTAMLVFSINFTFAHNKSFPYLILGSLFFFLSDSVLSFKTFVYKKNETLQIFILTFYYIAQAFITLGAIY